jgi:hypothetical protein
MSYPGAGAVTTLGLFGYPVAVLGAGGTGPGALFETTTIYGTLTDPSGTPRVGVPIDLYTREKIEIGDVVIEIDQRESTVTDSSGEFEVSVAAGQYRVTIDCNKEYCSTVPKTDRINIQDII